MSILTTHEVLVKKHLPLIMSTPKPQPVIIVGAAGSGKTYLATHAMRDLWAAANNVKPEEVAVLVERVADRDAAEFAGLMMPAKDDQGDVVTMSIKPDLVRKIEKLRAGNPEKGIPPYKYIVLVLDEICQADASVQKVLSSLLDPEDGTLGGHDLGEGIYKAGTGNRLKDKSGAQNVLAHVKNRVLWFEMQDYNDTTVEQWIKNYAEPAGVNVMIIDAARENAYSLFDNVTPADRPMCSFRSLTNVSHLLSTYLEQGGSLDICPDMRALMAAAIGEDAARIIADHCQNNALGVPSRDEILNNPEGAPVPDATGSQNSAGTLALSIATDSESADSAVKYIMRLRGDLQVQLGARLLGKSRRIGSIMVSDAATTFIQSHADLIAIAREIGDDI